VNPSASGWIQKFGHLAERKQPPFDDFGQVCGALHSLGFTYGMNTRIPDFIRPAHPLTQDENAKLNLAYGLYYTYRVQHPNSGFEAFLESVLTFYRGMEVGHLNFLQKILSGNKTSDQLEKLIDSRVYLEASVLSKAFNNLLTNSLLFVDVLTYRHFLQGEAEPRTYARELEYIVINITYQALGSKRTHPTDERLRDLFRASLTYLDEPQARADSGYRQRLQAYRGTDAACYFLDVASLTVWEDNNLEYQESRFVFDLGEELGLEEGVIRRALLDVTAFFEAYSGHLSVLREQNSLDSMTRLVHKLIRRNSKRLQKELAQSRDLVYLLSKSTVRDLSEEERARVREQLVDIFKSIPSLAIFMLPGGAVLLPIFIKLIPRLLPSSFDENRVDPEAE